MIPIQKIAKQTNITVRTLRYYEQIGLLNASSKTEGGHRLYTEDDLKKLQQIQFLKGIGYSLKDIHAMLTDPQWDWSVGLKNQLAFIMDEQSRLRQMESVLRGLISGMILEEGNNESALQKLIRLSYQDRNKLHDYRESMLNSQELELMKHVPNMSSDDPDSLEWIALLGQLKKRMPEGAASPKVQNLLRRMIEKQQEDFEGQDAFIQKLWDVRMSPAQSEQFGLYPVDQEVLQFLEQAYEMYRSSNQHLDEYKSETNKGAR